MGLKGACQKATDNWYMVCMTTYNSSGMVSVWFSGSLLFPRDKSAEISESLEPSCIFLMSSKTENMDQSLGWTK